MLHGFKFFKLFRDFPSFWFHMNLRLSFLLGWVIGSLLIYFSAKFLVIDGIKGYHVLADSLAEWKCGLITSSLSRWSSKPTTSFSWMSVDESQPLDGILHAFSKGCFWNFGWWSTLFIISPLWIGFLILYTAFCVIFCLLNNFAKICVNLLITNFASLTVFLQIKDAIII